MNIFGVIFVVLFILQNTGVYMSSGIILFLLFTLWIVWGTIKLITRIALANN